MLQHPRFTQLHRGVYCLAQFADDFDVRVAAARLALPPDAALSHISALRLMGYCVGPEFPLHFSTNRPHRIRQPGIVIHRRQGLLHATTVRGVRVLGAMRTFVDTATMVNDRNLLRIGDWLVASDLVDPQLLLNYLSDSHLDGVQRARRVALMVRRGVASPRESDVRWTLLRSGLPEPELNVDLLDEHGAWLARGDLVYRRWKVLVEYDGFQHERDARQRQWDLHRREKLEAAGWRVIVVTAKDMAAPSTVAIRVRQALRQRGFDR